MEVLGPAVRGHRECVPSALVCAPLRAWIERYNRRQSFEPQRTLDGNPRVMSGIDVVAGEAGLHNATIQKHLRGERAWMPFRTADRILCAIGEIHLWYTEPLHEWYATV